LGDPSDALPAESRHLYNGGELQSSVHRFFADRYWRLSEHHARRGQQQKAKLLDAKARWHCRQGGGDDERPAMAAVMGIPRRPTFTDAIGRPVEPPDDAA
jgi:hypothetical protein